MLCNKIDKPLVIYTFLGNVRTSIITLRKRWQKLTFSRHKCDFLLILMSVINRILHSCSCIIEFI